jgi:hypothetical protein
MSSWHSYASIYNMGHAAIADLLLDDVIVEEKVDGSQFSFGLFEEPCMDFGALSTGTQRLRVRSKGAEMIPDAPEKMFNKGVEAVKSRLGILHPGWTYRAEYLAKPKHNVLAYDRVPADHVVIFDINIGEEQYLSREQKAEEARRLGFEVVPLLYFGKVNTLADFRKFLEHPSFLGGQKVEGVVVKQAKVTRFGRDHKALIGKFVSEAFKESHSKVWKAENPNNGDVIERLIHDYHSQARWQKAVQHLREAGELLGEPRDIALLVREIPKDIEKECADEIKAKLWVWAWPKIQRGVMVGMPQWYKELLLASQFESEPPCETASPEILQVLETPTETENS